MKFYQGINPPRVWNGRKNKVTMVFVAGILETDDKLEKEILMLSGYTFDPEPELKPIPLHVDIKPVEVTIKPVKKVIQAKPKMLRKKSKKR